MSPKGPVPNEGKKAQSGVAESKTSFLLTSDQPRSWSVESEKRRQKKGNLGGDRTR